MLEGQNMFKQLQELQRNNKFQELKDVRQQNKQPSGTQYRLPNIGIAVRDPSQMFKFGGTNLVHGVSNQSAGLLTKQKSQQAETFGKSFIGDKLDRSSIRAVIKNEAVDEFSPLTNSAYENYESQSVEQMVKQSSETFGIIGRNSCLVQVAGTDRCVNLGPINATNEAALTDSSSLYLQHLDVVNKNMVVLESKKRKFSTFERVPWHEEVNDCCSRLHDINTAELEWAHSAGRIPDNTLEESVEEITDSLWTVNRKRRLIITTRLMQLLFRPASNITAYCDSVTYCVAKLALGDACSLCTRSWKSSASKSSGDPDLSKTVESFIDRSKRLKDEFSRLEKGQSLILEIRTDFQDLEKFSVINRIFKFHTRGKGDKATPGVASSKPKLYPERYVKAIPMPNTVPEGQNCLSL